MSMDKGSSNKTALGPFSSGNYYMLSDRPGTYLFDDNIRVVKEKMNGRTITYLTKNNKPFSLKDVPSTNHDGFTKFWLNENNQYHNENGYALIDSRGSFYYLDGDLFENDEFHSEIAKRKKIMKKEEVKLRTNSSPTDTLGPITRELYDRIDPSIVSSYYFDDDVIVTRPHGAYYENIILFAMKNNKRYSEKDIPSITFFDKSMNIHAEEWLNDKSECHNEYGPAKIIGANKHYAINNHFMSESDYKKEIAKINANKKKNTMPTTELTIVNRVVSANISAAKRNGARLFFDFFYKIFSESVSKLNNEAASFFIESEVFKQTLKLAIGFVIPTIESLKDKKLVQEIAFEFQVQTIEMLENKVVNELFSTLSTAIVGAFESEPVKMQADLISSLETELEEREENLVEKEKAHAL